MRSQVRKKIATMIFVTLEPGNTLRKLTSTIHLFPDLQNIILSYLVQSKRVRGGGASISFCCENFSRHKCESTLLVDIDSHLICETHLV